MPTTTRVHRLTDGEELVLIEDEGRTLASPEAGPREPSLLRRRRAISDERRAETPISGRPPGRERGA